MKSPERRSGARSNTLGRKESIQIKCKRMQAACSDQRLQTRTTPIRINGGWTPKGIPQGDSEVGKGPQWMFKMTFRPVMRRIFLPGWIDGGPCGSCLALSCTSSQAELYLLYRTS
ncbi:unnamed protein product [Boreogadus saida]